MYTLARARLPDLQMGDDHAEYYQPDLRKRLVSENAWQDRLLRGCFLMAIDAGSQSGMLAGFQLLLVHTSFVLSLLDAEYITSLREDAGIVCYTKIG